MSVSGKKEFACSGCNACAEICPKHCIKMVADRKGFLYPKVDTAVCIECGICEKICPFEKDNICLNPPIKAFAAWNKERKQYLQSSSGGAAYVFASYIIGIGGVVYGCTAEGLDIHYIRVDSQTNVYKLQGSKYVQSNVCNLYSQIKNDLKTGTPVLFIGTPCQVAGLKNYIRHVSEHLYLIDLICHGVPSLKMLKEHVQHIAGTKSIERISFRKGSDFRLNLQGKEFYYVRSVWKDMYYRGFMNGFTYRPSCYHCPFATSERISDLTIGDFWGLQQPEKLPVNPQEGISVLLPSTDKGLQLIRQVEEKMVIVERSVKEAVDGNTQLRQPTQKTYRSKLFSVCYPVLPLDFLIRLLITNQRAMTAIRLGINRFKHGIRK